VFLPLQDKYRMHPSEDCLRQVVEAAEIAFEPGQQPADGLSLDPSIATLNYNDAPSRAGRGAAVLGRGGRELTR
jgi:hypothetical protein